MSQQFLKERKAIIHITAFYQKMKAIMGNSLSQILDLG